MEKNREKEIFEKDWAYWKYKKKEEIRELEICPAELENFKEIKIFNKIEMEKMRKENVTVSRIGEIEEN